MEICVNLYASKDAFFSVVSMSRTIFGRNMLKISSQNIITIQAIAIVSIAAKGDSAEMSYTDVLTNMCSVRKEDLVTAEICVAKVRLR